MNNLPSFFWNAMSTLRLQTNMKKTRTPCIKLTKSVIIHKLRYVWNIVAIISNNHDNPITMNNFKFKMNLFIEIVVLIKDQSHFNLFNKLTWLDLI